MSSAAVPLRTSSAIKQAQALPLPDHVQDERKRRAFCVEVGRLAVRSLYAELTLYPKPGLVSLVDNGSHADMNAATFIRSLFSLRRYFIDITEAGINGAPFSQLKTLGIQAEARMLAATNGINTHRGAIFCLGMLCAAIGCTRAEQMALSSQTIRAVLLRQWGEDLDAHVQREDATSHGAMVDALHAAGGARQEAALGFPSVFEVALPALHRTLDSSGSWSLARIDALFALMAHVDDTNVYYRGGKSGAMLVKRHARAFLAAGGTANADWKNQAIACHRSFVAHRLSPGGAADLLAATCLLHHVSRAFLQNAS